MIPSRDIRAGPLGRASARRGGIRFSTVELRQIALAIGALTFAFTSARLRIFAVGPPSLTELGTALGVSLLAVLTGFLFHELAHKVVAQRYGCWAEFRASAQGLLIAVVAGLLGFVLAAPGAVHIAGSVSRRQNGRISVAGPGLNLVLGGTFLGVNIALGPGSFGTMIGVAAFWVGYVNVFLGGFNLLPIPPLDGSKIFQWNVAIWIGLVAVTAALFIAYMQLPIG